MKKEKVFNEAINKVYSEANKLNSYNYPKILYKYRNFDEYTIEMIKDSYLYLAPVNKMDDQFDCSLNFDEQKFLDHSIEKIILSFLKGKQKEIKRNVGLKEKELIDPMFGVFNYDGTIKEKEFRNFLHNYQDDSIDSSKAEAFLTFIKEKQKEVVSNETFINECKKLVETLIFQRNKTGLCSLTETNMSQTMWQMYSNNYEGYCLEYNIEEYINEYITSEEIILPVFYQKKRNFDPVKIVCNSIFNFIVHQNNQDENRKEFLSVFFKILSTKNSEWSLQKEWRIIGTPNKKIKVPKISKIYLGKNVKEENKKMILSLADELQIEVYIQEDDYEHLTFKYKKIRG